MLRPVRLPLLPLDFGPARGVEVFLVARLLRELGRGAARLQRTPPARAASSVASPCSSLHALRRVESGESSGVRFRSRSSRVSRSSDRGTRKDRVALSRSGSSRGRSRRSRSCSAFRSRSSSRERRRRDSSRSLSSRVRSRRDRSRSSNRYRSRRVRSHLVSRRDRSRSSGCYRSRCDRSRSSDLYWSWREHLRSPAGRGGRHDLSWSCDPPRRFHGRSQSRVRSLLSSDCSRSEDKGRRARREQREGVETVTVSQAPVVSEVSATVAPPVAEGTVTALPSAVQDLARCFLSLTGSSSQGAVGSIVSATVPASGASAPGGGAAAFCAAMTSSSVVARPPSVSAAVPGSSGRQQREEGLSCSSRCRRRRSSSGGTGRTSKKLPRERSPFPGRSSHCREESYRSSSSPSGEDRAESPPPSSGCAHGGTPGDPRPAPAGGRSPRPGPSGWWPLSSAAAERYRSGFGGHLSPPPLLRVRRTMTVLMPSIPWTSTGMTVSGLSWPSSGTSTAWKSRRVYHQLDVRLLLHRSMG